MFAEITSTDNPKVRLVRKLATRKGRSEEGLFVAEGINLISEIISGDMDIKFMLVADDMDTGKDERYRAVAEYMKSHYSLIYSLSRSIFDRLTDAEHGVDMLAVAECRDLDANYITTLDSESCLLVCDRVQDPGNMGTMIRTAVAAGYGAVALMPGTTDVYSPKVLRSTAGMIFSIPIVHIGSEDELFEIAAKTGRRIVVTVPEGGTEYYNESLGGGIALVIGNEGAGVSGSIISRADARVTIPMRGDIESLNAAVAAGILMYETVRE